MAKLWEQWKKLAEERKLVISQLEERLSTIEFLHASKVDQMAKEAVEKRNAIRILEVELAAHKEALGAMAAMVRSQTTYLNETTTDILNTVPKT